MDSVKPELCVIEDAMHDLDPAVIVAMTGDGNTPGIDTCIPQGRLARFDSTVRLPGAAAPGVGAAVHLLRRLRLGRLAA